MPEGKFMPETPVAPQLTSLSGWGRALVVFRKEFREAFRDKRVLFNTIVSPLLITPLILGLVVSMAKKQATEEGKTRLEIALVNSEKAPATVATLKEAKNADFTPMTREAAEKAIRDRKFKVAAILPDDADIRIAAGNTVTVTILLDEGNQSSQTTANRLAAAIGERGQAVTGERLIANGLPLDLARPFDTKEEPIKGGGNVAMVLIAGFLPYMLALYAILGGVSPANDAVAGEKERGTLETLLVSPASRFDLALGKFLNIALICLISCLLSVVGLLWPLYTGWGGMSEITKATGGLHLEPFTILVMILVQIPLATLGAGLLLAVSTYARNQKEAQTYLMPVILLVSVAAIMSMLLKSDSSILYALVPVLNAALVLKQALEGIFNPAFFALAMASSFVYALLAVAFAKTLFDRESVLLKA
jgi:sodium transport system permease protein